MININDISKIVTNMTIKCREDGRYEGRLPTKYNRKSIYGHTKAEVKNKAKDYLLKVDNGYIEPKKITLNNYIEYWLANYKYGKIEPSSYTRIVRVYENQIKNTIGNKLIGSISRDDIQKLIDEYAHSKDESKLLSKSSLKKVIQLLNPCYKVAIKNGIVFENPCEDVVLPNDSYITKKTKEQFSLSDDDMALFKKEALRLTNDGEYYNRNRLILLIILNLGLRAGEILCLEWENKVNMDERLVYIDKTLQCGIRDFEDNHNTVMYSAISNSTKTKSGKRCLKMNDNTFFYFQELKAYDERNNIHSKYVCCTKDGNMSSHRNLQKTLDTMVRNSGIQHDGHITLHTLRHTFGSTLIRRGVRISVVSKLMGHANITITYNKYIHIIKEEEIKAMSETIVC